MTEAGPERIRYRFGPLERRGLIAGWRGGQIATVAGGLVLGVLALRSRPTLGGALAALAVVAVSLGLASWPIAGRTGEQWCPLLVRWLAASLTGGRPRTAPAPSLGTLVAVDRTGREVARSRPSSRRHGGGGRTVFDGVRIEAHPVTAEPGAPTAGLVVDGRARTATAVLAVRGHSFALLGPVEQEARVASWARVLAALAREGSAVHRVQWVESCLPDDGEAARRHLAERAVLGADTAPGRSYAALVERAAPVTRRHRTLVAVTVHTGRSARPIRSSGGGAAGTGTVVLREAGSLQRLLEEADATVEGILGPSALAAVLRASVAPLATVGSAPTPTPIPGTGWPWPMAVEPRWDAVRTDGTWHATYWIAEWPRVEVTPDFLAPLLFSAVRRTLSLVMEPVSPSRAARQVAQARTADIADGELRRRGGFLVTARQTREKQAVEHRDVDLADGHAQYRFTGYLSVTADDADGLEAACAGLEQAAGQARLEVRRLYGEQDLAWACTLPLGRGLS